MKRVLAPALAAVVAVGFIVGASAGAQTTQAPTAPLVQICPVPTAPVAGQDLACKIVVDPFWTAPPTSTTTPTATSTTTQATTTVPVTTTTTVASTTTTSTPPASLMGWQLTTSNVGLAPHGLTCSGLDLYLGPAKPLPGTTISKLRVEQSLDLSAGDILIERSCLAPRNTAGGDKTLVTTFVCPNDCVDGPGKNVTIRDSEITGANLSAQAVAYSCAFDGIATLQRNYMHDTGSGICARETGVDENMLIEHNYVRGLRAYGNAATTGSHNEAATIRDFRSSARTITFRNNRLDSSGAGSNQSGALFIQPLWVNIFNGTLEGNLLEGKNYNLYIENRDGVYRNMRAVNNRFWQPEGCTGAQGCYGPSAVASGEGWKAGWLNNYRYDPAKFNAQGAVVTP